MAGMPDVKTITEKMRKKIHNNRTNIPKHLPADGSTAQQALNMVDALIKRHYSKTLGAETVKETPGAVQDLQEPSWEDLLVNLYNSLVPPGHTALKLTGVDDPRILDDASNVD